MNRIAPVVIAVLWACGAPPPPAPTLPSTESSPSPSPSPSPIAEAQPAMAPVQAALPPAPKATIAVENVIVAGPRTTAQVRAHLEQRRSELAACARYTNDSVAVEVAFAITTDERIPHVTVHNETRDGLISCITSALGSVEDRVPTDGEPTDVYAVIAIDRDGQPRAKRPPPPNQAKDFEALCSAAKRSGALTALPDARAGIVAAHVRKTVRHPAVTHVTWRLGNAAPHELRHLQKDARRAAKPRKCEDPGW